MRRMSAARRDDEVILSALDLRSRGVMYREIAERHPCRSKNAWIGLLRRVLAESDRHEVAE